MPLVLRCRSSTLAAPLLHTDSVVLPSHFMDLWLSKQYRANFAPIFTSSFLALERAFRLAARHAGNTDNESISDGSQAAIHEALRSTRVHTQANMQKRLTTFVERNACASLFLLYVQGAKQQTGGRAQICPVQRQSSLSSRCNAHKEPLPRLWQLARRFTSRLPGQN